MNRAIVVVLALLSFATSACTSSSSPKPPPADSMRVATAFTDDCPRSTGTGAALPKLTLPCLGGGKVVALHALTGKPALVNIWASWCKPCQREVPALQAVYAAAHGRMTVLGIDMEDTDGSALDFAKHIGMRYPSVVDRNGDVLRHLGFAGPPATLLVDASGAVVYRQAGEFKSVADLHAKISTYLKVSL